MEIRHLRQFLVLADQLHFGRAAEILGTAQPTLSQQILVLERDLGVRLFERNKRRVLLTDAGVVFHREARAVVEQLETALRHAREAAHGTRGLLRLGTSTAPLNSGLPVAVRQFGMLHPHIELSVEVMRSRELIDALRKRRLHVGFARAGLRGDGLRSEVLWEHQFCLVLPSGHPLENREAIRLADLAGESLITFTRALNQRWHDDLLEFCRTEGFQPGSLREVDRLDAIIGLVACGMGVTILPETWPQGTNIIAKPIVVTKESHFSALGTSAYWNDDESSPLVPLLLAELRHAIDAHPGEMTERPGPTSGDR